MHPQFLTLEEVLELHLGLVSTFGGSTSLLSSGRLESAIATPAQAMGGRFLHPDIPEMAAAYLFHVCQAHAFEDGNKRVALAACIVFLKMNGWELTAGFDAIERCVFQLAGGGMTKAEVTSFVRDNSRPKR